MVVPDTVRLSLGTKTVPLEVTQQVITHLSDCRLCESVVQLGLSRAAEALNAGKGQRSTMEPYKRAVGEQVSQGYRQLPSVANARGPELKTIVYAGVGIVMGILVGTLAADGSIRIPGMQLTPAQAHQTLASNAAPVNHPVAKPVQALAVPVPAVQVQAQATTTPVKTVPTQAQVAAAPVQRVVIPMKATPAPVPVAMHVAPFVPSAPVALATPVTRASVTSKPSPVRTVSASTTHKAAGRRHVYASRRAVYSHKHRTGRRLAAWRRHLARLAALRRRRELLAIHKPEIADAVLPAARVILPVEPVTQSAFTVEGEDTVASYDPAVGVIDTYEGETFALDKTLVASNAIRGDEIPSSFRYRCDQFRNCSLVMDGRYVPNVRRTR